MAIVLVLQLIHIWVSGRTHRHTTQLVRTVSSIPFATPRTSDDGGYSRGNTHRNGSSNSGSDDDVRQRPDNV